MSHALLAAEEVPRRPLAGTMRAGLGPGRGRIVARLAGRGFRRAELGPAGGIVMEVHPHGDVIALRVWGPAHTPSTFVEWALQAARRWGGLEDRTDGFADLVAANPTLHRVHRLLGTPIIGGLPRAAESFGRAVLGQLVQGVEAQRSERQMVAMLGDPLPGDVWPYPPAEVLAATPAHQLRRCGISLRGAQALHQFAAANGRVERLAAARAWHEMDDALTSLRGVGGWTSAETRLWLGDPDAVSVGDYHIPALVGWALGERTEDDASMLQLLAPYSGHRGRVIRLLERAGARGLVDVKPRRGPRAARSAHRYH